MATLGSFSDFITDPDVQRAVADTGPRLGKLASSSDMPAQPTALGTLAALPPVPASPPDSTGWQPGQAQRDEPQVKLEVPPTPRHNVWEMMGAAFAGQGSVQDQITRQRTAQSLSALGDFQPKFDKATRDGNYQTAQNLLLQYMPYAMQSQVGLESYKKAAETLSLRQVEQQQKQGNVRTILQSGQVTDPGTLRMLTGHYGNPATTTQQMMEDIKQFAPQAAVQLGQLIGYSAFRPGEFTATSLPAVSEVGQLTDAEKKAATVARIPLPDLVNARNRAAQGDPLAQAALAHYNQQLGNTVQVMVQRGDLSARDQMEMGLQPGSQRAGEFLGYGPGIGQPPPGGVQPQGQLGSPLMAPGGVQPPQQGQPSLAQRMNNPLNVKVGPATQKWLDQGAAVPGAQAQDGGRFLQFQTPAQGYAAAQDLLTGPNYQNLSVDAALRKWSNNGYGAEIVPGVAGGTKVSQLTPAQLQTTLGAMAQREGGQVLPQDATTAARQATAAQAAAVSGAQREATAQAGVQFDPVYQGQVFYRLGPGGKVDMAPPGASTAYLQQNGYRGVHSADPENKTIMLYRELDRTVDAFQQMLAQVGMPGEGSGWDRFADIVSNALSKGVPIPLSQQLAGRQMFFARGGQQLTDVQRPYLNAVLSGVAGLTEMAVNPSNKDSVDVAQVKDALLSSMATPEKMLTTLRGALDYMRWKTEGILPYAPGVQAPRASSYLPGNAVPLPAGVPQTAPPNVQGGPGQVMVPPPGSQALPNIAQQVMTPGFQGAGQIAQGAQRLLQGAPSLSPAPAQAATQQGNPALQQLAPPAPQGALQRAPIVQQAGQAISRGAQRLLGVEPRNEWR